MKGRLYSMVLMVIALLMTSCATQKIRYLTTDSEHSHKAPTVTFEPIRMHVGEQIYDFFLSATGNSLESKWTLLVNARYPSTRKSFLKLKLSGNHEVELHAAHTGWIESKKELHLSSNGFRSSRVSGYRSVYVIDRKDLDILSTHRVKEIIIQSPRGCEVLGAHGSDKVQKLGLYASKARYELSRVLSIPDRRYADLD